MNDFHRDLIVAITDDMRRGIRPPHDMARGSYKIFRAGGKACGRRSGTPGKPLKMDAIKVVDMRRQRAGGVSYAELGRRFGVSLDLARRICLRMKWSHVQ